MSHTPTLQLRLRAGAVPASLLLLAGAARAEPLDLSAATAVGIDGNDVAARVDARADIAYAGRAFPGECSGPVPELARQDLMPIGPYIRTCECIPRSESVVVDDIRGISDKFSADGNARSRAGLSNMVWGFGQFLDHDLALSIENEDGRIFEVDTDTGVMELHRAVIIGHRGCKNSVNAHTALVDAGPVYGSDPEYLQSTLREPGTCRLRVADGDFLPVSTSPDANGEFQLIAGDVRVSEHAFLAAQHTVWVREHNRLCEIVEARKHYDKLSADAKFDLVQNVVVAKFQQVVLEEFLPALGITQADLEAAEAKDRRASISVEFSIAYRLGHDLIGNDVGGIDIADAFGSERFFLDTSGPADARSVTYKPNANAQLSNVMLQLSTTRANEVDGKLSDALRNFLFGRDSGEDLAGRNIFRGRELAVPTYGGLAKCFGLTPDPKVEHETPDAWLGLLREPKAAAAPIPPTLRAILIEQFHRIFFGRNGRYWRKSERDLPGFVDEVERSTYATIITANTDTRVTGNVFKA